MLTFAAVYMRKVKGVGEKNSYSYSYNFHNQKTYLIYLIRIKHDANNSLNFI